MTRDLSILQASVQRDPGEEPAIVLAIVSEDLKSRPVHLVPITEAKAIALARQLLESVERVRA